MIITRKDLDRINELVGMLERAQRDLEKLPKIHTHHVCIHTEETVLNGNHVSMLIQDDIIRNLLEKRISELKARLKSLGFVEN